MDRLVIGQILKPQGIRGELKVKPLTDTAEDMRNFKVVFIDDIEYKVLSFRVGAGEAYLGLRGIADRNAAERMRGKYVEGRREDAAPLPEGVYYIVDIIGCTLYNEDGKKLGVVQDVTQAATDIYTLQTEKGELLIPVPKGLILDVDIEEKKITVDNKRFLEVSVCDEE